MADQPYLNDEAMTHDFFQPDQFSVPTQRAMRGWGKQLAEVLRPGDLVILTGELGAGKTTLTQGIGAGLGVRGPVASPTFVIARVHPSEVSGPALVHVDAYRLNSWAEVDDLDLDSGLSKAVTIVEWGEGMVEGLAPNRLEITIVRDANNDGEDIGEDGAEDENLLVDDDEPRQVIARCVGVRWAGVSLPLPEVN
ncbi:MAG: tRNA (adenosine(37)-N6)-threonylcarbamoyltransferase complex ATPase subunit type 1 TsaE [Actinomycetota bacterium]